MITRVIAMAGCGLFALAAHGVAHAQSTPAAPPVAKEEATDDIIVNGTRGSIIESRNIERRADGIVSAVTSDDVGNFPDQNVAETLQRLPGVSISRSEGEGRFVSVRGLDPAFNNVTVNGVKIGSTEKTDGAVALDIIPSDLLDSIVVVKTPDASFDGDAIGGTIEIRSLSAFDRGDALRLRAEGGLGDVRGRVSPRASAQFTRLFDFGGEDTLGIALAASYHKRFTQTDDLRNDEGIVCNRSGLASGSPLADFPCPTGYFVRPQEIDQRALISTRERYGATLNIEFRPDENNQFYLRGTATRFNDDQTRFQQEIEPRRATDRRDVRAVGPNSGTLDGVDFERQVFSQVFDDRFYSLAAGGEHQFGAVSLTYQADWSDISRTGNGERVRFRERRGILDFEADRTSIDFTSARGIRRSGDPSVLANYELDQVLVDREEGTDTIYSIRADLAYEMALGADNSLTFKAGGRFRRRDKDADVDEFLLEDAASIIANGGSAVDATPTLADYGLQTIGGTRLTNFPAFPNNAILNSLFTTYAANVPNSSDPTLLNSNREDFDAREEVLAGYGMATLDLGESTRIIGGVRVEQTKFETTGSFVIDVEDDTPIVFPGSTGSNDYTDILPSVILRHDMGNVQLRAAWTNAIQRGNFEDINNVQIGSRSDDDDRDIDLTNPGLDPARATQFDAGLAWFPNRNTSLQVTGFYKRIDDFIVGATFNGTGAGRVDIGNLPGVTIPLPAGLTAGDRLFDQVSVPINGDSATIYGIEFAWSQNYTFLPGALAGLFTTANVTWAQSSSELEFRPGADLPFPGQPEWTANASFGYENDDFSTRVSVNYRSDLLSAVADIPEEDTFRGNYLAVDFSARFTFIPDVQIYMDISNITGERDERYFRGGTDGPLFERIERFGRTFQVGLRYSF
jgi:iron complex outermembrane recepter protein